MLGVRSLAMALACGNTVVMKGSELCPGTHTLLVEVLAEAGFPEGALQIVTNAPEDAAEIVSALIAHPAIRHINFTGSSHVGRIIAEQAGRHLKPVLLELGGKSPLVVLEDADLDEAVRAAAFGAFMHQGQICMSTERIVVDNKVGDAFADKFAAKAAVASALIRLPTLKAKDHEDFEAAPCLNRCERTPLVNPTSAPRQIVIRHNQVRLYEPALFSTYPSHGTDVGSLTTCASIASTLKEAE